MAIELSVQQLRGDQSSASLDSLTGAGGTLYLKDGVIQESKFSLGRAFLGLFSSTVRQENQAALNELRNASTRIYGQTLQEGASKLSGRDLGTFIQAARETNRTRMDSFVSKMQAEYGRFAQGDTAALTASQTYTHGLAPDADMQAAQARIKQAETQELSQLGARLRNEDLTPEQFITELKNFPHFQHLLDLDFALGKDFTIGVHTQQVLGQFESQKGHYDLAGVQTHLRQVKGFENFEAERFMKVVLAFHDIGKGEAVRQGKDQHAVTVPILKEAMAKMGFPEEQIRLAANLVDNDLLGEWQVGRRHSVTEVRGALRGLAQDSGIPMRDYLVMQKLFYISDASSYEPIRASFMEADGNGKLHFKENNTDTLLTSIGEQHGQVAGLTAGLLFSREELLAGDTYPISLFNQDFAGKGYNFYDMARSILDNQARLSEVIDTLPEEFKATATARLNEAVEMARCAQTMDADRWSPDHTQGVIVARMEIRKDGISGMLPRTLSGDNGDEVYLGNLHGLASLRGPGSPTDKFYALVDAKGGSSHLLQVLGQCQMVSSWCPTSLALKGYLHESRSLSAERYYMADHDQHGSVTDKPGECYARFAHAPRDYWTGMNRDLFAPGGNHDNQAFAAVQSTRQPATFAPTADSKMFDLSVRYQLAMQMEMLANFDFPGNDRTSGQVVIHRVECGGVLAMYGIDDSQPGSHGVMKRGTYDSGSIICPVLGAGGAYATTQTIPYHRVIGSFFLGAQSSTQGPMSGVSIMHTDAQREITFMTDGIETTYVGDGNSLALKFMHDYQPPQQPGPVQPVL